jgi:ATP-binding cassette, subfamily B, heavy metal transporter
MGNFIGASPSNQKKHVQMYSKVKSTDEETKKSEDDKNTMASLFDLSIVLRPYFWPDDGSDGAAVNRARSSLTWLMVALSKTCSLLSPIYISRATNYLVNGHYTNAITSIFEYAVLRFLTSFFKEMQSVIYLKVKQQANIQLAESAFSHVHSLSLNWHLSKKMGNVIRSMDRGTSAADNLVPSILLLSYVV